MGHASILGAVLGGLNRLLPAQAAPLAALAFDAVTDGFERIAGQAGPMTPPVRLRLHVGGFVDSRAYRSSGQSNAEMLRSLGSIASNARVLDIGCGTGRIAAPLTGVLSPEGSYEGFDLAPEPIRWCAEHISPNHPNFRFRLVPGRSAKYNPKGTVEPADVVFPYADQSFDLTFAISVYTHMLPETIGHYIAETRRVLRPGGVTVATFYLVSEDRLSLLDRGGTRPRFLHSHGSYRIESEDQPEGYVAQAQPAIERVYAAEGLSIAGRLHYGAWARDGRADPLLSPFQQAQDVIVAVRDSPPGPS